MDLVEDCYGYACKGPVAAAIILCLVAAPIGQGKSLVKAWWNECYGAAIMIAATFSPGKWWGVAGTVLEPAMHPALEAIDAIVPLDWVRRGVRRRDRPSRSATVEPANEPQHRRSATGSASPPPTTPAAARTSTPACPWPCAASARSPGRSS